MKVLHIVWTFKNGGVETMLVNIINRQINIGYKVGLMIINNIVDLDLINTLNKETILYQIKRPEGSKNVYSLLKSNYFYLKFNANIVHFHFINISDIFIWKGSKKWITTVHTTKTHSNPYRKRFDNYIAISNTVKQILQKSSKKINPIVCYNAIDFNRITIKQTNKQTKLKIVCIGRIEFHLKGQDLLVNAVKLFVKKNNGNISVDIIGDGSDFEKLKKLVNQNNLEKYIHLLGNISNSQVLDTLHEYNLFIQASRFEGFGLTAIEAMASGVPVILSEVEGHLEVSSNGKYCLLFKNEDVEDLYHKIIEYNKNYYNYYKVAKNAQISVKKRFSIQKMVDNLDSIYKLK